jgi:hypothetical protein
MVRKNWIPRSDIDFDGFFGRYTAAAVKNTSGTPPVWPHIPPDRAMALNSACVAWHAARAKLNGPHTSGDVLAKNGLRAECETVAKPRCGCASGVCSANSTLGYKGTASPPPKGSQTATRFESGRSPTPSASQNCFAVLLLEFAQAQTPRLYPDVNPRSGFTTTTRPAPASTPPRHWPC